MTAVRRWVGLCERAAKSAERMARDDGWTTGHMGADGTYVDETEKWRAEWHREAADFRAIAAIVAAIAPPTPNSAVE